MKKRFNLKEQEGETSEEELYDSLGTVLELATTMCNDHENETYHTLDPHEALECLYEIDTPRAHRLIEMIKFYDDELDSMGAKEDYRDDDEYMDEYGEDELPDWMGESKVIKLKESDLQKVLNETHVDGKGSNYIKDVDKSSKDNNDLCDELTINSVKELKRKMRGMSIPKKDKVKIDNYIKEMNKTNKELSADLDVNNTYLRFIQNILCTYSKEDKNNIDESKVIKLNEDFSDDKESLIFKVLRRLKGVTKDQLEYNMKNDLPWDWRGSKEGFYEKMEPRKNYTGSN